MKTSPEELFSKLLSEVKVGARSFIITLFGDAIAPHGARVWMGSLIRLLEPFGINEGMARTAVLRLTREHWLRAQTLGKRSEYFLTEVGLKEFEPAARHIWSVENPKWDGRWRIVVALPGKFTSSERRYLRIRLAWQGFGRLGDGVHVHPSASLEEALAGLAVEESPELGRKVLALTGDPPLVSSGDARDLVREAWDLDGLSTEYARFVRRYAPLTDSVASRASPDIAFALRTLLIHEYRRLLLRDPELPDELLPADWQGRNAQALTARIYRALVVPSEAYLATELVTAAGRHPPVQDDFKLRFGGLNV